MKKIWGAVARDLWIVILDMIAVNLSYYLALILRFYVNSTFRPTVSYLLTDWARFTPWYTILSILIFVAWKLYGGMWRYAGINDMNRIIGASLSASILHLAGTLIFIRRMPITYYVIGAVIQLFLLIIIRFAYRVLLVEKKKLKREETLPAIVVGAGDLGRKVVHHLEENTPYRAAVIISSSGAGRSLDGVPVEPLDSLESELKKRNARAIFIADKDLSEADRERIRTAAGELEISDFTGALSNLGGAIPLSALLNVAGDAVTLVIDGKEQTYKSGKKALEAIKDTYDVDRIEGDMKVFIKKHASTVDTAWLESYKATTGEDISFF